MSKNIAWSADWRKGADENASRSRPNSPERPQQQGQTPICGATGTNNNTQSQSPKTTKTRPTCGQQEIAQEAIGSRQLTTSTYKPIFGKPPQSAQKSGYTPACDPKTGTKAQLPGKHKKTSEPDASKDKLNKASQIALRAIGTDHMNTEIFAVTDRTTERMILTVEVRLAIESVSVNSLNGKALVTSSGGLNNYDDTNDMFVESVETGEYLAVINPDIIQDSITGDERLDYAMKPFMQIGVLNPCDLVLYHNRSSKTLLCSISPHYSAVLITFAPGQCSLNQRFIALFCALKFYHCIYEFHLHPMPSVILDRLPEIEVLAPCLSAVGNMTHIRFRGSFTIYSSKDGVSAALEHVEVLDAQTGQTVMIIQYSGNNSYLFLDTLGRTVLTHDDEGLFYGQTPIGTFNCKGREYKLASSRHNCRMYDRDREGTVDNAITVYLRDRSGETEIAQLYISKHTLEAKIIRNLYEFTIAMILLRGAKLAFEHHRLPHQMRTIVDRVPFRKQEFVDRFPNRKQECKTEHPGHHPQSQQ